MNKLKITVIGGGSSYTPEIIEGFIKRREELPVSEINLVDIEAGRDKLEIVGNLAKRMVKKAGVNIKINLTTDRREALKDSDFVVTQLRVGGLEARARDERFPLKYDVIGQETTGPGGFAKALRTIPVIMDICKDMKELCPNAFLINFANPSGLVTEAVNKYTDIKCIGLCNVPVHMKMNFAEILEVSPEDLYVDFAGLNHLVWVKNVWLKGQDVTMKLIDIMTDGETMSMKNIPPVPWDRDYLKALGCIPSPYHRYYLMSDKLLEEEKKAASPEGEGTRAEVVKEVEARLFELYKDEELKEKPKELEKRGGAYYSEAAVSLISAIYNDKREVHVVNIVNNGTIKGLPDDCVIERNCLIDRRGATPITLKEELPIEALGVVQAVKAYEVPAVDSAVKGDKDKAFLAMANHPLVPSVEVAKKLLEELFEINKDYLKQFKF